MAKWLFIYNAYWYNYMLDKVFFFPFLDSKLTMQCCLISNSVEKESRKKSHISYKLFFSYVAFQVREKTILIAYVSLYSIFRHIQTVLWKNHQHGKQNSKCTIHEAFCRRFLRLPRPCMYLKESFLWIPVRCTPSNFKYAFNEHTLI